MPKKQTDQEENSKWKCRMCQASGPCVKGDEEQALLFHLLGCDVYHAELKRAKDKKKK